MPSPRYKPRSYIVANVRYQLTYWEWVGNWLVHADGVPVGQVRRESAHRWHTFTRYGEPVGSTWRSLKQGVEYLAYQRPH